MGKWILGGLVAALLVTQLIPVERINPPVTEAAMALPVGEVGDLMKAACLDCHSNETVWPWYSNVGPGRLIVGNHVNEGRSHLNFSTWAELTVDRKDHKLEEMIEMVEDGEMPEGSYTWLHPEARLTEAQRTVLVEWAKAERAALQSELEAAGGAADGAAAEEHSHDEGGDHEH